MDTITFNDLPSILFVLVERATTPRFMELGSVEPFQTLDGIVVINFAMHIHQSI
jgi:hypothetical protein